MLHIIHTHLTFSGNSTLTIRMIKFLHIKTGQGGDDSPIAPPLRSPGIVNVSKSCWNFKNLCRIVEIRTDKCIVQSVCYYLQYFLIRVIPLYLI